MKKVLLLVLSLVVAISLAIPIAMPVGAVPYQPTYTMTYLGINSSLDPVLYPESIPLKDQRVRAAIYFALDRETIATSQGGTRVKSIIDPSIPNPNVDLPYNVGQATNLLILAAYPNGFGTILTPSKQSSHDKSCNDSKI
jgi:ABC-type transport system substrate-binding protein